MTSSTATRLSSSKNRILSVWEQRAWQEVASSSALGSLALRDGLPDYLDHLAEALSASRKMDRDSIAEHNAEALRIGIRHGSARAASVNYVLGEVIDEYLILREVLFNVLEEEGPLDRAEREIIFDSIGHAIRDAAVQFAATHADIQQKFINTLTHDLKNPLASAKANAQLIMKRADDPELCLSSASRVIASIQRLDTMVRDLLDASRLRAGEHLSVQLRPCDLDLLVRQIVAEMSVIHGDRFVVQSEDAVIGQWSADTLIRAIENLVENAVKYLTPKTPITISVKRLATSAQLVVHNEGNPIPESEQPILFQQYRRTKSAQDSLRTGWGLGLTLVKGVADAHRGTVKVESSEAKGTSFILELPLEVAPTADKGESAA